MRISSTTLILLDFSTLALAAVVMFCSRSISDQSSVSRSLKESGIGFAYNERYKVPNAWILETCLEEGRELSELQEFFPALIEMREIVENLFPDQSNVGIRVRADKCSPDIQDIKGKKNSPVLSPIVAYREVR